MSFLGKGKKEDLKILAEELGEEVSEDLLGVDLKNLILESKKYDEEFVKEQFKVIIDERKAKEERETQEQRRREEQVHEIKLRELELRKLKWESGTDKFDSQDRVESSSTFLSYLNMVKGTVIEPPGKNEEWPFFFHQVERMFKLYEVPDQFKGKIILHCLKSHARSLNAILDLKDFDDYDKIKETILREHRITPLQYKRNLDRCFKVHNESYAQYAVRVEAAWELYLKSRKVEDFHKLKELLIADKIKDSLPSQVKSHILLKETDKWLEVNDLVREIDNFLVSMPNNTQLLPNKEVRSSNRLPFENHHKTFERKKISNTEEQKHEKPAFRCFKCHEEGHSKKNCPKLSVATQGLNKIGEDESTRKGLNEVCCEFGISGAEAGLPKVQLGVGEQKFIGIIDSGAEITVLRKSVIPEEYLKSTGKILLRPAIGLPVEAILTSIPLSIWTEEGGIRPWVQIQVAVAEGLHEAALVTPRDYSRLKEQWTTYLGDVSEYKSGSSKNIDNLVEKYPEGKMKLASKSDSQEEMEVEVYTTPIEVRSLELDKEENSKSENPLSQVQLLRKEQLSCPTLQKAWKDARAGKNNYFMESDLLYHTGMVGGQKYTQLVVPVSRRREILKLAHEMPTGGHLAAKKTRQRIAMSFWWDGMPKEVGMHCASCHDCQMRRKIKVKERAPIEAVGRPELPFQVMNADILGPIEPKSSRGHQYLLCMMDQHSRWPEAVGIKSLTAKATCEAFLEVFMRTGVPQMIAMDNGTNFAARLSQEMLKRLGCVPRFSTPGYPQSNGMVERWIGTMKNMLHHAIKSQGRGWDKQLPFLLWAYREVPNSTTGVSPFLLVYGRPPVGPLSILKSSWEEEGILPQGVGESVTDYLHGLRERLKDASDYATQMTKPQQDRYVSYHNLRSSDVKYDIGDEVVLLAPDSTNRLCAKWTGPGEIVNKKSSNSYMVKLPDGSIRHVHGNKLRKYIQPTNVIGVIYESDEDFGDVQHAPVNNHEKLNNSLGKLLESQDHRHLNEEQKRDLCEVLGRHQKMFDGEVKCAKVGSHVITLKPNVERRQPHIYKVPETLKGQVEKQITDLLNRGLIEPSSAQIAYPIVCVAKKDGTIRLCVDYRGLNAESKIAPFPMQNSEELRFKAGSAKYLTTLDLLKGYWEIPLDKDSRELTSFVSSKGQYQWKVMAFGLAGASGTFQRTMNQVLKSHSEYAESFIDDIIIYSANWQEHLSHIDRVLSTLEDLNFSANIQKCHFAKSEVKYLGHIIGSGTHGPDPGKLAAIRRLKFPKTKNKLRSILGLFNYYREYVPHYSEMAKPLTDLTSKKVANEIPCTDEAQQAFEALKDALVAVSSLSTPDLRKPYEIHTDASLTGIGACLMQKDDEGKIRPITFASQKLTPAQSKWSAIEREAYAVIWALGKFEVWTYGSEITLYSDHNPLKFLTEGVPRNARLQRWALALSRYRVRIAHKPGRLNSVADALSRVYETKRGSNDQ